MSAPTIDRSGHVEGAFITGVCAAVLSKVIDPAGPFGGAVRQFVMDTCSREAATEVARGFAGIHQAAEAWDAFLASPGASAQTVETPVLQGSVPDDEDDEITPDEAAGLLGGITPSRVRQLYHDGALPGRKRGGRLWLSRTAVLTEAANRASRN